MTTTTFTLKAGDSVKFGADTRFTLRETRPDASLVVLFTERREKDSFGQPRFYHRPRSPVALGGIVPSACHLPFPCEVRLVEIVDEEAVFEAELVEGVPVEVGGTFFPNFPNDLLKNPPMTSPIPEN